jgi:hypothetical protein
MASSFPKSLLIIFFEKRKFLFLYRNISIEAFFKGRFGFSKALSGQKSGAREGRNTGNGLLKVRQGNACSGN